MEKEKSKIWSDEKRVINVKVTKDITESDVINLFQEGEEMAKKIPYKTSVLIDLSNGFPIFSSEVRKGIAENFKKIAKDPGFKKVAVFGEVKARAIASFILTVYYEAGDIKVFETKKEALEWLKEP